MQDFLWVDSLDVGTDRDKDEWCEGYGCCTTCTVYEELKAVNDTDLKAKQKIA